MAVAHIDDARPEAAHPVALDPVVLEAVAAVDAGRDLPGVRSFLNIFERRVNLVRYFGVAWMYYSNVTVFRITQWHI